MNNKLIERCKAYALEHYDEGFDTFVECYGEAEWLAFVEPYCLDGEVVCKGLTTWPRALEVMQDMVDVWNDRRADAAHYSLEN